MSTIVILVALALIWFFIGFSTPRHKRGVVWAVGSIIYMVVVVTLTWFRNNA